MPRVALEGMILKPNMIVSGKKCAKQAGVQEVAERTLRVLRRTTPSAVPGIAFLSGGQSDIDATAHLDAMNKIGGNPWPLTFSYGRALQARRKRPGAARRTMSKPAGAFAHRALMNWLAAHGQMEQEPTKTRRRDLSDCRLYLFRRRSFRRRISSSPLRAALDGGDVASFQLRLKHVSDDEIRRACDVLRPIVQAAWRGLHPQ